MERMTPNTIDFNSLSKKQLVELVIAKYNDCFRLEEENKELKEHKENLIRADKQKTKHIDELEEENKNLKLIQETNEKQIQNDIKERDELREENKKLKSDLHFERNMLDNVRAEYESLQNVIKELKEELKYYKEKSEFLNKVIVKYQEENNLSFIYKQKDAGGNGFMLS